MNLNEKLLEAIESKGKRLEYDELSRTETDVQAAANECEAIAVEWAGEWLTEKPEFTEDCILLTAIKTQYWNYSSWRIEKTTGDDTGWYWGWLDMDGDEYGDIEDLKADRYKIILPPKQ